MHSTLGPLVASSTVPLFDLGRREFRNIFPPTFNCRPIFCTSCNYFNSKITRALRRGAPQRRLRPPVAFSLQIPRAPSHLPRPRWTLVVARAPADRKLSRRGQRLNEAFTRTKLHQSVPVLKESFCIELRLIHCTPCGTMLDGSQSMAAATARMSVTTHTAVRSRRRGYTEKTKTTARSEGRVRRGERRRSTLAE